MTENTTEEDDIDEAEDDDENWQDTLSREFAQAKDRTALRHIKTKVDFATAEREVRALLEDFLPRVVEPEDLAINLGLEFRRRIVEELILNADVHDMPFETHQRLWNELVELGFSTIEVRCSMSHFFIRACIQYGQTEIGLALLDPLIAELERLRTEPGVTDQVAEYYESEIKSLQKRRTELEALRA